MNFVPLSVAELELVAGPKCGRDGATAVVHRKGHGALDHLHDEVVFAALDSHDKTRNVSRLDLHRDVEVKADVVLPESMDVAALRT